MVEVTVEGKPYKFNMTKSGIDGLKLSPGNPGEEDVDIKDKKTFEATMRLLLRLLQKNQCPVCWGR